MNKIALELTETELFTLRQALHVAFLRDTCDALKEDYQTLLDRLPVGGPVGVSKKVAR